MLPCFVSSLLIITLLLFLNFPRSRHSRSRHCSYVLFATALLILCILRVSSPADAMAAELKDAIGKRLKKTDAVEKRGDASGSE